MQFETNIQIWINNGYYNTLKNIIEVITLLFYAIFSVLGPNPRHSRMVECKNCVIIYTMSAPWHLYGSNTRNGFMYETHCASNYRRVAFSPTGLECSVASLCSNNGYNLSDMETGPRTVLQNLRNCSRIVYGSGLTVCPRYVTDLHHLDMCVWPVYIWVNDRYRTNVSQLPLTELASTG